MKRLQIFHLLLGLVTFFLMIFTGLNVYIPSPIVLHQSDSVTALLLVGFSVNLLIGSYMNIRQGVRKILQIFGSILLFSSLVVSFGYVYDAFSISEVSPYFLACWIMTIGTWLHVLANLDNVFVSRSVTLGNYSRETGSVKWFNFTKGFGFITRDLGGDVFVHYRSIRGEGRRSLTVGQRVEFVVIENDKGLQAEDVVDAPKGR